MQKGRYEGRIDVLLFMGVRKITGTLDERKKLNQSLMVIRY